MTTSYVITPSAHLAARRRRCRAQLEQIQPQLPHLGDRPRRIVDRTGATRVWSQAAGGYISID